MITAVPMGMRDFSRTMLIRLTAADGTIVSLPIAFLLLVIVVALTWLLLNRTMLGRSIYALGGAPESALRVGINVVGVQYFVYAYVGVLSSVAGIVHGSLARVANPFDLVGLERSSPRSCSVVRELDETERFSLRAAVQQGLKALWS